MNKSKKIKQLERIQHLETIFQHHFPEKSMPFFMNQNLNEEESKLFKRKDSLLSNIIQNTQHVEQLNYIRNEMIKLKEELKSHNEQKEEMERGYKEQIVIQTNLINLLQEELSNKKKIIASFDSYIKSFLLTLNHLYKQITHHSIIDVQQYKLNIIHELNDALDQFQRMPSLCGEIESLKFQVKKETSELLSNKGEQFELTRTAKLTANNVSTQMKTSIMNYKKINHSSDKTRLLTKKSFPIISLFKRGNMPYLYQKNTLYKSRIESMSMNEKSNFN